MYSRLRDQESKRMRVGGKKWISSYGWQERRFLERCVAWAKSNRFQESTRYQRPRDESCVAGPPSSTETLASRSARGADLLRGTRAGDGRALRRGAGGTRLARGRGGRLVVVRPRLDGAVLDPRVVKLLHQ